MEPLQRVFDRAIAAAYDRSFVKGILGKPDGAGGYVVAVPGMQNKCYVRVSSAGGESVTIAKNLNKVPYQANLHVLMWLERGGTYTIDSMDPTFFSASTTNNETNPWGVPPHTHAVGTPLNYSIEALRLEPGRVYPIGGWTVTVNPFRYYTGAWQTYEGEDLTLASNKPTTTGKHRWVVVTVDPTTNAAEAFNGSDEDYATDLEIADIDAISIGDNIPLCAVIMRADDVNIADIAAFHDAKGWLNMSSGSGLSFSDAEGDPANVAGSAADGTSTYAARRDHAHTIGAGVVTSSMLADGAALAEILDDDGTGSGLDADLLDGNHAAAFAVSGHSHSGSVAAISLITDWNYRDLSRSTSLFAWKGNEFTPDVDILLYALGYFGTIVANGVYKGAVMTATGSPPSAVNAITFTGAYTVGAAPANLDGVAFWLEFATPVTLTAGTIYGLMLGRTDGTDTYALPIPFLGGNNVENAVMMPGLSHGRAWRIAKANPVTTDAIDRITTNAGGMGYRYRISGSTW